MKDAVDNTQDTLDARDVIARFEELESERDGYIIESPRGHQTPAPEQWEEENPDEAAELESLESFLDEMRGNGGDEKWRGHWYPVTLVRESYFEDYAREYAEEVGDSEMRNAKWPFNCIDWEKAASELQMDYTGADFGGVTYYFR